MQESKNESSFRFNKRRSEGKSCIDMPNKNPQHKVPKLNPTSTVSYVQILGTGMDTQDTSPSVLLFVDEQRFIFNAGEKTTLSIINLSNGLHETDTQTTRQSIGGKALLKQLAKDYSKVSLSEGRSEEAAPF
ncbi:hypothetical protein Patl1_34084 [Pistacia atlantica]|uniref:Uncharacterized protein n=1 Tax=Pistacia atlantica TaxID=434234 RepID=A0ACC0ZWD4_9ROSI|nr:hypothetical protein Patl1_34084 [Pistacia atlantica]